MTQIKICGLSRVEDILAVNEAGPDYCGFIINFPRSHRNVTIEKVKELRQYLDPSIKTVGVIVDQPMEIAEKLLTEKVVDIVQLHGNEDGAYIMELRKRLGAEGTMTEHIWKAYKIRSHQDLEMAMTSKADRVLLDNGYGTGEVFDWSLVTQYLNTSMEQCGFRNFILAGGLTPENIPEAIAQIHPMGIDISSGVETDKKKDREKILAAVRAVNKVNEE